MSYWLTYVLIPLLSGILAAARALVGSLPDRTAPAAWLGIGLSLALFTCAALNLEEYLEIASALTTTGRVLLLTAIATEVALALLPIIERGTKPSGVPVLNWARILQKPLGYLAIAMAIAMVMVRVRRVFLVFR